MNARGRAAWWHPDRFGRRRTVLMARSAVLAAVRRTFADQGFVEVDTPALQVSPGMEPHLWAFATELDDPDESRRRRLYLHTSPEFAMKKLLVAGMERIFQIGHVFRNRERSDIHHPEFTMAEWYRAGADYLDLIDDCRAILSAALNAVPGQAVLSHRGLTADPAAPWTVLTVAEAFRRYADIDLMPTAPDPDAPASERRGRDLLAAEAARIGIRVGPDDDWEDLFFRIHMDRIEPHLGVGAPTVLAEYPASMAALSRRKPEDPRVAERFELYVCGMELANAFGELTDAVEQRGRFNRDMDLKERLYGVRYPLDDDFLSALGYGLPRCAGIALGFDRLVMLATGAEYIDDVLWAPVAQPDG